MPAVVAPIVRRPDRLTVRGRPRHRFHSPSREPTRDAHPEADPRRAARPEVAASRTCPPPRWRDASPSAADRRRSCPLHGLAIWIGMGGLRRADQRLAALARRSSRSTSTAPSSPGRSSAQSWTTAGYDPSFMAGYAKSVVFPASSTLPELVVAAFGGARPELAYKVYVLVSAAAVPWLIAAGRACSGGSGRPASAVAVLLVPALRLDRLPDQLRGVRDAAVLPGDPAGTGGDRRVRAVPASAGRSIWWLLSRRADEPGGAGPPHDRDGRRARRPLAGLRRRGRACDEAPSVRRADRWPIGGTPGGLADPGRRAGGERVLVAAGALAGVDQGAERLRVRPSREACSAGWRRSSTTEAPIQSDPAGARACPGCLAVWRASPVLGAGLLGFCAARASSGATWPGASRVARFPAAGPAHLRLLLGAGGRRRRRRSTSSSGDSADGSRCGPASIAGSWPGCVLIGVRLLRPARWSDSVRDARLRAGEPFLSSRPSPRLLWVVDRVTAARQARRAAALRGGRIRTCPGVPDPFQRRPVQRALARADRGRGDRRSLPARLADDQFHPVRRGEAVRQGRLGPRPLRPVRAALPAVGDPLLEPARAAVLPGEPRPGRRSSRTTGPLLIGRVIGLRAATRSRGQATVEAEPGRLRVREHVPRA